MGVPSGAELAAVSLGGRVPGGIRAGESGIRRGSGNPPFLNGTRISTRFGDAYRDWLLTMPHTNGKADLVAFFLRKAFALNRDGGAFGLIATITIAMGDTRPAALEPIIAAGGVIYNVMKRIKWPGLAAVTVNTVNVIKSVPSKARMLNGKEVQRITAFLFELGPDTSPLRLSLNSGTCFSGPYVMGAGFLFDDDDGSASPTNTMRTIISSKNEYEKVIRPYICGEEFLTDPRQLHRRYVIYLGEITEKEARSDWPLVLEILEKKVKQERSKKDIKKYPRMVNEWWKFWNPRHDLMRIVQNTDRVLMIPFVASHVCVGFVPASTIVGTPNVVICRNNVSDLATIQSRIHELWVRFLGSTMEGRQRYTPSDCFETFPFPPGYETDPTLEAAGQAYHDHRAALMIAANEGMTKTYNRFHKAEERGAAIQRLRELHDAMDQAVLRAYGWDDLADTLRPVFHTPESEDDHTYQTRLFLASRGPRPGPRPPPRPQRPTPRRRSRRRHRAQGARQGEKRGGRVRGGSARWLRRRRSGAASSARPSCGW